MTRIFFATWATAFVLVSCWGQTGFMVPEWVTLTDRAWQALRDALVSLLFTGIGLGLLGLWIWAGVR